MREKSTFDYQFLGVFNSNRISKATNDVHVHFLIHSSNSCSSYRRITRISGSYYVFGIIIVWPSLRV
jgi:hypothetical protein